MIRKILRMPIELLKFALFIVGAIVFLCLVFIIFVVLMVADLLQNNGGVDPVIHSKDGKVVDLNDFRADKTRGES